MEKMIWEKPEMNEVAFAANEYVASCDDTVSKFWKFICNVGGGQWMDIYKGTYDSTKDDRWNHNNSENLTSDGWYYACGTEHYVKQEEGVTWDTVFAKGWADSDYWEPGLLNDHINYTQDVYIWTGDGHVHATTSPGELIETVKGNKS